MKTKLILGGLAIIALAAFGSPAAAQTEARPGNGFRVGGFLDENGDGFNDLAPDADGDGIPNGLDPDFVPAGDGSGNRVGEGNGEGACGQDGGLEAMLRAMGEGGNSYGPGDGSGFGGEGPGDGTGFGPGTGAGDGACDGTAATGSLGQRGRR